MANICSWAHRVGQRESLWQFSGHSFGIGAATTAARYGIPDLARPWASDAYQLYARTPVESSLEVFWRLLQ